MLLKKITLGLLSLCLIGTTIPSEAGMFSKAAKEYVVAKAVKKVAPSIVKKAAQNKAKKVVQNRVSDSTKQLTKKQADNLAKKSEKEKLAKKPLINGELKVGRYDDLIDAKKTTKKLTDKKPIGDNSIRTQSHHVPSDAFMKKQGISKEDGIAVEMQEARHGLTRTYKGGNSRVLKDNETPREALARDVKDFKDKYRHDSEAYKKSRVAAQEVIKQNKESHPQLFNKK